MRRWVHGSAASSLRRGAAVVSASEARALEDGDVEAVGLLDVVLGLQPREQGGGVGAVWVGEDDEEGLADLGGDAGVLDAVDEGGGAGVGDAAGEGAGAGAAAPPWFGVVEDEVDEGVDGRGGQAGQRLHGHGRRRDELA